MKDTDREIAAAEERPVQEDMRRIPDGPALADALLSELGDEVVGRERFPAGPPKAGGSKVPPA